MSETAAPDIVSLQPESNGKRPGGVTGKGFTRGVSGNPKGKRKGSVSLTARLKSALTKEAAAEIVAKLINMAQAGDLAATKLLWDRTDGPLSGPLAVAMANTAGGMVVVHSPVDPDLVTGGPPDIVIRWPHETTPQQTDI